MNTFNRKPILNLLHAVNYTTGTFIYLAKEKIILNMVPSYFSSLLLHLPLHCDLTMTL